MVLGWNLDAKNILFDLAPKFSLMLGWLTLLVNFTWKFKWLGWTVCVVHRLNRRFKRFWAGSNGTLAQRVNRRSKLIGTLSGRFFGLVF